MSFSSAIAVESLLVFLPTLVALGLLIVPGRGCDTLIRWVTLAAMSAVLLLSLAMACGWIDVAFDHGDAARGMQHVVSRPWIPSLGINYTLGFDGISLPLIVLTTTISWLAMAASWRITRSVKAYCILLLLLETGMLGVFVSVDLMLFYVFWELVLLPMFFLIGVWGGPRREYAAVKFFVYTLVGSVLLLIGFLLLYFASDIRELDVSQVIAAGVVDTSLDTAGQTAAAARLLAVDTPQHTFNILALQQLGQHTTQFDGFGLNPDGTPRLVLGHGMQWWVFVLLFIGFAIKLPSVPLHTWLPDAHVEAPTPVSMILAGVLLKLGGYGILRICYPVCPLGGFELAGVVCSVGVVSMLYGALAAIAQTDFKRMVALSSVSHMGYVLLGLGVWSATPATQFETAYWQFGLNGAMYQMIAHGVIAAGLFYVVGVLYERVHHRELNSFGGILSRMPVYSGLAICLLLAGLGLPGFGGFFGEFFVLLSVWSFSATLAIAAAATVVLTAAYILSATQRVYFGAEYRGPHADQLRPASYRELGIAGVLVALAVVLGVYPQLVLKFTSPTISQTADDLATWTERHSAPAVSTAQATDIMLEPQS